MVSVLLRVGGRMGNRVFGQREVRFQGGALVRAADKGDIDDPPVEGG